MYYTRRVKDTPFKMMLPPKSIPLIWIKDPLGIQEVTLKKN